jgi:hypothetical protein
LVRGAFNAPEGFYPIEQATNCFRTALQLPAIQLQFCIKCQPFFKSTNIPIFFNISKGFQIQISTPIYVPTKMKITIKIQIRLTWKFEIQILVPTYQFEFQLKLSYLLVILWPNANLITLCLTNTTQLKKNILNHNMKIIS